MCPKLKWPHKSKLRASQRSGPEAGLSVVGARPPLLLWAREAEVAVPPPARAGGWEVCVGLGDAAPGQRQASL